MENPHSRNLRKGRVSLPNHLYLITTATHQRTLTFSDITMGRIVVRALMHQQQVQNATTLAYVIMPDHLHWLLQLGQNSPLSTIMNHIKSGSARHINQRRNTPGRPVWQDGYHDRALRQEEDIRKIARYIVANPLRAKLVTRIGDYPLWDAIWL